ncbi:MAG: type I 3-dehydroquinate dehydratase [Deltaproteobacteria bacterium]|nr:type I 3-dehydroquinate dehydratase [Deltaproteobacteria bacterium]
MWCVPIMAGHSTEAIDQMTKAASVADMFELRLDVMTDFDVEDILSAAPKPVLVTYRSLGQGGQGIMPPARQVAILRSAAELGAAAIDVEFDLPEDLRRELIERRGTAKAVLSHHLFNDTPPQSELIGLFHRMMEVGADVIKIITFARAWADNLRTLSLIPLAQGLGIPIIAFCMGPLGQISRIFNELAGGYLSFAPLDKGAASAPGQIPIQYMKKIVEILQP